ncbi:MAG TPA: DUF4157 domain-containing protein [Thermodesulfobacteriota bacterium]|nr:DUF4157 domain-containing protein [Thermodesulfobacteriota bacterium]
MCKRTKSTAKVLDRKIENLSPQTKKTNLSKPVSSPVDHILSLQRTIGNQAVEGFLKSGVIQAKLTIGQPGDVYEQEADRVAEQVMRMPEPSKARSNGVSEYTEMPSIQRVCTECEEELQRQTQDSELGEPSKARRKGYYEYAEMPSIQRVCAECEEEVHRQTNNLELGHLVLGNSVEAQINSVRRGGQPLPESVRDFFEPRFGQDFSGVKVHTDSQGNESAKSVNALAYTIGTDIVFGAGQYAPGTESGKRLIAHELTHVVQQKPHWAPTVHRQKGKEESSEAKRKNLYFVIGDAKLNVGGGVFLKNLEALRTQLLKTSSTGEWTLTITIHGAETFFASSAGDVTGGITESDPKAYNKSKINTIFGDKKFQAWREKHGPTRVNLLSCQIGNELENTFLKLVLHPTSNQRAVGLGQGCILYNTAVEATINDKHIKTRKEYDGLSEPDQKKVLKTLTELNDQYGYNGIKIDSADILDYYFDVAPEGLWVTVNVLTKKGTLLPYLGRQSNTTFITECDPNSLRQRQPRVPRVPD